MLLAQQLRWVLPLLIFLLSLGVTPAAHGAGGDPVWQFADTQSGKQEAKASVVDSGGNVIVTGYQNLTGVNDDYYTVKFKFDGSGVAWRAVFDKAGGSDQPTAIFVDGNNDIIVTGLAWNGTDNDIHTIKYDGTSGAVLWQHTFNGAANRNDVGTSIAVDRLNNVYVGGYSQNASANDDYIIIKYSPSGPDVNGDPLWQKIYDGEAAGIDRIASIAVGGDVIAVTGRSWNGTAFDMLTIKYDLSGTNLWERRYSPGTARYCTGNYVKLDAGGNVVVTGSASNGTDLDIYTVKYSESAGDIVWEQTYNGAYDDEPNALFIDSTGDVYVAGYTWTLGGFNDFYTVKYDGSTGVKLWQQIFNSGSANTDVASATGLVVDPAGDVFVTGYTVGAGNFDFQTIKYKKDNGNQLWRASNPTGPSLKPVRPVGIGLSPSGEVLVARWVDTLTKDLDFYVIKYDSGVLNAPTSLATQASSNTSIQLSWADNSANEDGFSLERCQGVGCTAFIQIATTGPSITTYDDTGLTVNNYYSYRLRAFSGTAGYSHYSNTATGLTVMVNFVPPAWSYLYNSAANKDDFANAIAVGPDNNPVVTGQSDSFPPGYVSGLTSFDYFTLKLNRADSSVIWSDRYNDPTDAVDIANCIAVDSSNAITVSGYATLYNGHSGDVNSLYTVRYPANGPPQTWAKQYNGPIATGATDDRSVAIASASDASGNVVVVGYGKNAAVNNDIYVVKYKGDGTLFWAATPFDGAGGDDFPTGVAIASDGSVFVTGYTEKIAHTNLHSFYTAKYNGTTGVRIWSDVYSVTGTGDNIAKSLTIDATGDLYITGYAVNAAGNKDFYTIKYNGTGSTVQRVWERSFDGLAHGDDEAIAIKIDPVDGNLVVGGTSLSSTDNHDFTIIRYTQSGDAALTKTYQRPTSDDHVKAMGVDSNGNIYLAGNSGTGSSTDSMTVKFDYLGNISNAVSFNGAANNFDESTAIAINSLDEAFVAGYTENAAGNGDYLVYKINPDTSQPFMPYGVTATSTYVTATLTWLDKSTVKDGYRIERKTGACGPSNINPWGAPITLPISPASYTDIGLNSGSTYCYRLVTYQNIGAASRGAEKTVSTPALPVPSNFIVPSFNSTQANLTWGDTTTGETGFHLERCTGASCNDFTLLTTLSPNATSYSDPSLCNGTVYRYRVMAFGTGWNSPFSGIATVTTTAPGTPLLTATRFSEVEIRLSWTDPNSDESGYNVERCMGVGCSDFTQIISLPANTISYSNTGLNPNTSYSYRVTAFKTAACSWTRPSIPSSGVVTTILEPNSFTTTANSTTQITIAWADRTASETGFVIDRCTGTGCTNFAPLITVGAGVTSYADASVTQGTTYRYQVRASNSTYPWDSPITIPVERIAPSAATPVLTSVIRISEAQVNLAWTDANTDESGFKVERCTGVGCSDFLQVGSNLAANIYTYIDTTVLPDTTYTYRVSTFKTATSNWTMTSITPLAATTTLNRPTGLAAATLASNTTQITLNWTDNTASENGFKIERCTGTGCVDFAQIGTTSTNVFTYADTSVTQGTVFRYRVRAYRSSAPIWDSLYSDTVEKIAPAAVTPVLTATRGSEAQINLTWSDANTDESGFKVERCTGTGCSDFTQIGTNLAANIYSYNDTTGLIPNTVYTYRVSAFKTATAAWTMPSLTKEATTTLLEPNNFSCIPASTTQLNCSWTDRTASESDFRIERCTNADCSDFALQATPAANATTYSDTTVCTGLIYNYRIRATRSTAPLWDSNFSIAAPATASSPSTPVLAGTTPSETQVNLTWTDSTGDETGYKVERCIGVACSNFIQIGSNLAANTFLYNDTGLTPGTSYSYRVKGYKSASCAWETISNSVTIVPTVAGPSGLTVATVSTTQINLAWTDTTTSETGFKIERCAGTGCSSFAEIGTASVNSTTYNDTSACNGNSYTYRVRATKSTPTAWDSEYSNTATGITSAFNNLLADSGFENIVSGWPTAVGVLTGTSFETTPVLDGAKSLKLAATGTQLGRSQSVTVIPGRQYVLSGYLNTALTAGTAQCDIFGAGIDSPGISITFNNANNNAGWVNLSETVTIPTGTTSVAVRCFANTSSQGSAYFDAISLAPADFILTATRVSDIQINLSWPDSVADETGYKIERCAGIGCTNFIQTGTTGPNAASYIDTGLTGNITYRYQIKGYKTAPVCGWDSGYSAIAEAVTTATAPSGLTAAAANTTQINLNWTDNTLSESGFKVERCAGSGCSDYAELAPLPAANAISYSDTTAAFGTTYKYRVRATNATAGWNSVYSNESLPVSTPTPAAPVLTATAISDVRINLSWTDPTTDETGYKLERCQGADCTNFVQIGGDLPGNTTSYGDLGIIPNNTYVYRVKGFKTTTVAWTTSSNSSAASTTILGPTALGVTVIDTTQTRLSWANRSTTETAISIERCQGVNCSDFASISTVGSGVVSYNDTTLCNNQPYSYRVRAINTVVPWTTDYSNTVSVAIPVPPAPTALTTTRVNETLLNLSWTDNTTDETGYKIERCEGSGCTNFIQLTTVLANIKTYSNTSLTPNITYRYQVRAYKTPSGGCPWDSGYSNITETVTSIAVPTGLTATAPNSTQVNLTWTNNTVSETGYTIERCAGAGCSVFADVFVLTGKATTWTDNMVAAGTIYNYRIKATNTTIPWDSGYSIFPPLTTYPQDPPGNLQATATASKVTLTWIDKTVDETGFKIERCTGGGCADFAQIALVAAGVTTYVDTTVCNGITYNYRARATKSTDRAYDTLYSNTATITTSAGTIVLSATRASEIQINLSWSDPTAEEDGYRVERCVGSGCSDFTQMAALAKNSVSWTDTGLYPGYTYTYRVKNYNSTASCPWETASNVSSAVTSISAPTALTAVPVGMTQINLSWSDTTVTKIGFKIERCTGSSCSDFVEIAVLTGSTTTWSDMSVVGNSSYRYRVRATKTTSYAWDSGYSSIAAAATASTPAGPIGLSAQRFSNSQINLAWNDVITDGTGYKIERCSGSSCSSYSEIAAVGAGIKTYNNTGLTGSTNYCYRVRGYKTGTPSWTTSYSSTSCTTTGMNSPNALTAAPLNSSEVKLTWTDSSVGANGYNVEEQIWNGEWVTVTSVSAHETSFTDGIGKEPQKLYTYRVKAFNGADSSSYSNLATVTTPAFVVTADPICLLPSEGPVISSTPVITAGEGTLYSYAALATAQGGRTPLTYTLARKPDGMTVSSVGLITWTPGYTQGGDQNVTLRVTDSAGYSTDQNFAVTVTDVNRAPSFTSTAITTAMESHPYSYQAAASDPESDLLVYTLVSPSPAGMTISSAGLISWTPTPVQAGDNSVTVRVSDGNLSADQLFTVSVGPNHAPVFTSTPAITAKEGVTYNYQVAGSDSDGDAVTYTLTTAPAGMTISSTRLITWTPTLTQSQLVNNPVTIQASDGSLTATQSFTVAVVPNHAPVIPTTPPTTATENSLYTYTVGATDQDGDVLTYTLTGAPSGMTMSAAGVINWTPDYNQAGLPSPTVTVRASDITGLYVEKTFTIVVANVNRSPIITSSATTTGTAGLLYSYQVIATDPDGTAISGYTLTTAPAGMSISGTGLINWTPSVDQATNPVTVIVSDGTLAATQSFNIDVQGPPAIPVLVAQPNFTSNCVGTSVVVYWNSVAGPRGHAVQYAVRVNGGVWSAWQSGTSYTLPVSALTSYTWQVKARDGVTLLESVASIFNTFGDITTSCCSGCECDNSCASSCPLVYSWDGSKYNYETDLQGPAISQIKKGSRNVTLYQPSYIVLENGLATDETHQYRVKIWESLQEASLVDEATLLAVDYPVGYQIVSSAAENTYYYNYFDPFKVYTIKNPVLPISATDKNGIDILASALYVDNNPVPMAPTDPDNFYTLDFGTIQHPEYAKLVIDAWQDINSKVYMSTITIQPYIEVKDASGAWVKVKSFGMPAGDLKTMVIDISGLFLSSDHHIRLHLGIKKAQVWVFDRIRLDDSAPVNVTIQQLQASSADLQVAGHAIQSMTSITSRIIATDVVQPIKTDFFGYGNFTKLGDVKALVTQRDDKYVVMNYADKLELKFPEPLPPQPGIKRGFVLKVDNYYKDFKDYKYVEPLPFHGMSDYPYPATETYPADADHNQYLLEYNTRIFIKP